MSPAPDALELAQALIRCPSVTPEDRGALDLLQKTLTALGFTCHRLPFDEDGTQPVDNLYARLGDAAPHFCFAGHTDVVPPGPTADWEGDPFDGRVEDGMLFGRGATDMKGAIAAFIAATARFLNARGGRPNGSISLLITGDEEGPAINGTAKMLGWLKARGERIDACLVGEPTNPERLGEMVKIGRRGSVNAVLTVEGTQGHAAYPDLADNPLPRLIAMLGAITETKLDEGTAHFQPSTVALTSIDTGNAATNVIPARASAKFNIRFNDLHNARSIEAWLRGHFDRVGGVYDLKLHVTGEAFLTPPGALSDLIAGAVERVTGAWPTLSTSGGTSDARFIKDICPVAEFGLISQTMHKADERVAVADIERLTDIYEAVLNGYFHPDPA